jgi:hypothetical protein
MYRTRFPGQAVALCGVPEGRVEAGGARVDRAEVAVPDPVPWTRGSTMRRA